jgi:hypothetical protein
MCKKPMMFGIKINGVPMNDSREDNKKHGEGCSTSTMSATMEESPQCLSLKSI